MTVAALILGAGRGERFQADASARAGAPPKALTALAGRSLLAHAAHALAALPEVEHLLPVLPAASLKEWDAADELGALPLLAPVAGGRTRRASVAAGLAALPRAVDFVLVHDAARPLLRAEDAARVLAAARAEGAALLAVPVYDALHRVQGGRIAATLDRAGCWAAQTPQAFRRDWLEAAHARAAEAEDAPCHDDAQLVARLGHPVRVVAGRVDNFKITTRADHAHAERLLRADAQTAGSAH